MIFRSLISYVEFVLELLLVFRLVFKFLVVNTSTPFVVWIYRITAPLVSPFAKILPDRKLSNFVVDSATVAAIIVYAIAAYVILMILPSSPE